MGDVEPSRGTDDLRTFDFRRPTKFTREHMRSLQSAHEVFVRRLQTRLTQSLRAVVELDAVSLDQITYEDYTRSIPNPAVLVTISAAPLPGPVLVEMSTQMALTLLDRLLGGTGAPVGARRPTELETGLIAELMGHVSGALEEALAPLQTVETHVGAVEYNPQFLQAVAPTEMVLMLTYRLGLQTTYHPEGLFSLCYPFSTLAPAMERLARRSGAPDEVATPDVGTGQPLREHLPDVALPVSVRLRPAPVPAGDLAVLRPGDVIRLTHRVDEPAVALVGDAEIMRARIGRRGARLAVQIADWEAS